MSSPYEKVKGGRLTFKGGALATTSKSILKNKKKKKQKKLDQNDAVQEQNNNAETGTAGGDEIYTIDAAKKLNYEQLFPVEAKKFAYKDKNKSDFKTVEDALDDRVKKKADRYLSIDGMW